MPTDERGGRLYHLDEEGTVTRLRDDVAISNGMAFAPDHDAIYVAETKADMAHRFDYDEATSELSNPGVAVDTSDVEGAPDGTEERCVEFPARKVSCVGWGGEKCREAYVTTALDPGEDEPGTREEEGNGAGALFCVDLGVRGVSPYRSAVDL